MRLNWIVHLEIDLLLNCSIGLSRHPDEVGWSGMVTINIGAVDYFINFKNSSSSKTGTPNS